MDHCNLSRVHMCAIHPATTSQWAAVSGFPENYRQLCLKTSLEWTCGLSGCFVPSAEFPRQPPIKWGWSLFLQWAQSNGGRVRVQSHPLWTQCSPGLLYWQSSELCHTLQVNTPVWCDKHLTQSGHIGKSLIDHSSLTSHHYIVLCWMMWHFCVWDYTSIFMFWIKKKLPKVVPCYSKRSHESLGDLAAQDDLANLPQKLTCSDGSTWNPAHQGLHVTANSKKAASRFNCSHDSQPLQLLQSWITSAASS